MKGKETTKQIFLKIKLLLVAVLFFILENPSLINKKGLGFFAFIVYVPVLILIHLCNFKESFLFGGLYGCLSYGLYAYWLKSFDLTCFIAVCAVYFIFLGLIFLLLKLSDRLFKKNSWLIQWLCLCGYEYLKTCGFLGFSYGITAYTQWKSIYLIQICNIIGVYGLNAFIIFLSAAFSSLVIKESEENRYEYEKQIGMFDDEEKSNIQSHIENERKMKQFSKKSTYICIGAWSICFFALLIYGKMQSNNYDSYKKIKVAAIQNNDSPWKNGIEEYNKSIHTLFELTDEALELNPDLEIIVWPETAVVPGILYNYNNKNDENRKKIINLVLEYINSKNSLFVIGNTHKVKSVKAEEDIYNSALVFVPQKNVIPPEPKIYSKMKLVPLSESFPYKKLFPNIYRKLCTKNVHMWTQGKELKVFTKDKLFFSTPICFEDTFPTVSRNMAKNGSKCFINLSNDSWSNSVVCQNQHLAMAVFRSVENHVPTIRSTTSGQTCIIMPDGKISALCEPFLQTYAVGTIPVVPQYEKMTIYTRIGDIFGIIPIIVFLILLIIRGIFVIIELSKK